MNATTGKDGPLRPVRRGSAETPHSVRMRPSSRLRNWREHPILSAAAPRAYTSSAIDLPDSSCFKPACPSSAAASRTNGRNPRVLRPFHAAPGQRVGRRSSTVRIQAVSSTCVPSFSVTSSKRAESPYSVARSRSTPRVRTSRVSSDADSSCFKPAGAPSVVRPVRSAENAPFCELQRRTPSVRYLVRPRRSRKKLPQAPVRPVWMRPRVKAHNRPILRPSAVGPRMWWPRQFLTLRIEACAKPRVAPRCVLSLRMAEIVEFRGPSSRYPVLCALARRETPRNRPARSTVRPVGSVPRAFGRKRLILRPAARVLVEQVPRWSATLTKEAVSKPRVPRRTCASSERQGTPSSAALSRRTPRVGAPSVLDAQDSSCSKPLRVPSNVHLACLVEIAEFCGPATGHHVFGGPVRSAPPRNEPARSPAPLVERAPRRNRRERLILRPAGGVPRAFGTSSVETARERPILQARTVHLVQHGLFAAILQ